MEILLFVETEHEKCCANDVLTNKEFFLKKETHLLVWYFKTFMVDARPLKQTKAWLTLVLVSFTLNEDFPSGSEGKASAYNVRDPGSHPRSRRSPGEGNGNPRPYSCLENLMDGGAW